jgi:hypothetical protein
MGIKNYYLLTWKKDKEENIADTNAKTPIAHELISSVIRKKSLGFDLVIKDGQFLDYQPNSLAWPIISEKLKKILEAEGQAKHISFIPIKIYNEKEFRRYYILIFDKKLDVINESETLFVPGTDHIIKPVFSAEKIQCLKIFHKPTLFWSITPEIYIDAAMKKTLQSEGISGIDFEKASVR